MHDAKDSQLAPAERKAPPPNELAQAQTLVRWLDDRFLDPALGLLLPGVGDLLSIGVGGYFLLLAWRRRLSPIVLARMAMNVGLDAAVGALPIVGDLVDFVFKAHRRNLRLLETHEPRSRAKAGDWLVLAGAVVSLAAAAALPVYALLRLLQWALGS